MKFYINPLFYRHILGFTDNNYAVDAIELIRNSTFYDSIALSDSTIRRIVEVVLIDPDQPTSPSGHRVVEI